MKPYPNSGAQLKKIRSDLKLTQDKLSKKLGIHIQFVSNAERGVSFIPKPALKRLMKLVNREQREVLHMMIVQDYVENAERKFGFLIGKSK